MAYLRLSSLREAVRTSLASLIYSISPASSSCTTYAVFSFFKPSTSTCSFGLAEPWESSLTNLACSTETCYNFSWLLMPCSMSTFELVYSSLMVSPTMATMPSRDLPSFIRTSECELSPRKVTISCTLYESSSRFILYSCLLDVTSFPPLSSLFVTTRSWPYDGSLGGISIIYFLTTRYAPF